MKPLLRLILTTLLALACALPAVAGDDLTPLELNGVQALEASGVAALQLQGRARLVDTRALHDFLSGHIPDALHVDYRERSVRTPDFRAADDDVPAFLLRLKKFVRPAEAVVFYCNGPACWKSYKAATAAREAGYRRVYWFRGGMSEWATAGFTVVAE